EIVEEDVVDARDAWLDVPWYGDIEDAEGAIAAATHRRAHAVERHHGAWCGGRAEEQVDFVQRRPALLVMHRERTVAARQLLGALVRSVRDDRGADSLVHQTLERELGHLSRTEDHRATTGE